jgi:hypothetical protein
MPGDQEGEWVGLGAASSDLDLDLNGEAGVIAVGDADAESSTFPHSFHGSREELAERGAGALGIELNGLARE